MYKNIVYDCYPGIKAVNITFRLRVAAVWSVVAWHILLEFGNVSGTFGSHQLLVVDVSFAGVAPDGKVGEAENHSVFVLQSVQQHVLVHVATAVHLKTRQTHPVLAHVTTLLARRVNVKAARRKWLHTRQVFAPALGMHVVHGHVSLASINARCYTIINQLHVTEIRTHVRSEVAIEELLRHLHAACLCFRFRRCSRRRWSPLESLEERS